MRLLSYLLAFACVAIARGENTVSQRISTSFRDWDSKNTAVTTLAFGPSGPASEELYNRYVTKGGALMCALQYSDQFAGDYLNDDRTPKSAASRWCGDFQQDMATWGWKEHDAKMHDCQYHSQGTYKIEAAFRAMGIDFRASGEGGNNVCYSVQYWDKDKVDEIGSMQWYHAEGTWYRTTMAKYQFAMIRVDGAIFIQEAFNPEWSANKLWGFSPPNAVPRVELPKLRSLSDMLWGYWVQGNPDVKNIRIYGADWVENEDTQAILNRALTAQNQDSFDVWPGVTFTTDTPDGKVLLGSPIGATIAYFLMQHKAELGFKIVTKITVFKQENIPALCCAESAGEEK